MEKSFLVTVRGQYQALAIGTGIPTLKNYEETFKLPSQEAALSSICKHLLSPRLKKNYPDYIKFRTHELTGIELLDYTPNRDVLQMSIDDMNILELHDFCILRQIMIDPYKHAKKDIFAIRAMVQKAYSDKRIAQKEATTSASGEATKEADRLRKLNDLPPTSTDPVINLNEQRLTADAKANQKQSESQSSATNGPEADEELPPVEVDDPNLTLE